MKLLFLCNEYPPEKGGGIGIFTRDLCRALAARGHSVHVLGIAAIANEFVDEGVRVRVIKSPEISNARLNLLAKQWFLSGAARSFVANKHVDLVEGPDYRGAAAFLNFPTRLKAKVVVRYHGTAGVLARAKKKRASKLIEFLERRGLMTATHRVAVSQFVADATRETYPGTPAVDAVIPNFIDVARFQSGQNVERERALLLFVGKISINKGAGDLFAALPVLFEKFPELRLEIAGGDSLDGPGGTSMRKHLVRELPERFRGRVNFLGQVDQNAVADLYRRATVCVFPSRVEAMSLAPMEAMACGCAVVVGGAESYREVVSDGVTALIAKSSPPENLAGQIGKLLENKALRAQLGRAAAAEAAAKFNLPEAVMLNEAFYHRCLGGVR